MAPDMLVLVDQITDRTLKKIAKRRGQMSPLLFCFLLL